MLLGPWSAHPIDWRVPSARCTKALAVATNIIFGSDRNNGEGTKGKTGDGEPENRREERFFHVLFIVIKYLLVVERKFWEPSVFITLLRMREKRLGCSGLAALDPVSCVRQRAGGRQSQPSQLP